ncbi:MAG TPA: glycosyl hydrolase family 28 protein [Prolixibacteraceae bacterium]|nr:glycosyl hydrolase family 28 protein [Prolixibacteraceae bacterium]
MTTRRDFITKALMGGASIAVGSSTMGISPSSFKRNIVVNTPITDSQVATYPKPSIYNVSEQIVSLKVNDINVPVIKEFSRYDYSYFSFGGNVTIEITASEPISSNNISPLAYGIKGNVDGNKLTFTLDRSRYLIVRINNFRDLVIAADTLETDVPDFSSPYVFNVKNAPFNADATGASLSTKSIQMAIDKASEVGGGTVYLPEGIFKSANLMLKSNVNIYLAGGAVLRGADDASVYKDHFRKDGFGLNGTWFIYTEQNAHNIKIFGRGTIDANGFNLRKTQKYLTNLIVPLNCTNFTIDGIICRDSGLWGVIPTRSNNIIIRNTKHFNENGDDLDCYENDAVDVQECSNVSIDHSIMISEDDTFSTKTWEETTDIARQWPGSPQKLENVMVNDCVAWSRCATYKIGFGNFQEQKNIIVKNSISYGSSRAIAINPRYGNTCVSNITFENIDIEGFSPKISRVPKWLEIYNSARDTYGGPVTGITIKNINVRDFGETPSVIQGSKRGSEVLYINGVSFVNIRVPNKQEFASSLEEMNIEKNAYTRNVYISNQKDSN